MMKKDVTGKNVAHRREKGTFLEVSREAKGEKKSAGHKGPAIRSIGKSPTGKLKKKRTKTKGIAMKAPRFLKGRVSPPARSSLGGRESRQKEGQ